MADGTEHWIGLGVVGNFAGHLEQAGEAAHFVGLRIPDAVAPKGLFPFYVPGSGSHFLHCDPMSSERLLLPGDPSSIQIEPEVGLWCDLEWADDRVTRLRPTHFGAHDDCSIRRPDLCKISEKKNWGPCTKGFSATRLPVEGFSAGSDIDAFRLASYLERDGKLHPYGVDSGLASYSYFHERLLDWLVDRMNHQQDDGPLESIADWLQIADRPTRALISIGATRYTDFGEAHFVEPGDRAIVVVYDARRYDEPAIRAALEEEPGPLTLKGASVLARRVEHGASAR